MTKSPSSTPHAREQKEMPSEAMLLQGAVLCFHLGNGRTSTLTAVNRFRYLLENLSDRWGSLGGVKQLLFPTLGLHCNIIS